MSDMSNHADWQAAARDMLEAIGVERRTEFVAFDAIPPGHPLGDFARSGPTAFAGGDLDLRLGIGGDRCFAMGFDGDMFTKLLALPEFGMEIALGICLHELSHWLVASPAFLRDAKLARWPSEWQSWFAASMEKPVAVLSKELEHERNAPLHGPDWQRACCHCWARSQRHSEWRFPLSFTCMFPGVEPDRVQRWQSEAEAMIDFPILVALAESVELVEVVEVVEAMT